MQNIDNLLLSIYFVILYVMLLSFFLLVYLSIRISKVNLKENSGHFAYNAPQLQVGECYHRKRPEKK